MSLDPRALAESLAPAARAAAPMVAAGCDEDERSRRALRFLADGDWLGWTVPAAWGGHATGGLVPGETVSVRVLAALRHELAWADGLLDLAFVEQGLGSYAIALGGGDELRHEVLPLVGRGRRVAAFAVTEEGAGSDLAAVRTLARPDASGFVLTGTKTFITNAGIADEYTVLARTTEKDEGAGFVMLRVPKSARGLEVRRFEVMAPHPIGEVLFHDVKVPLADRLGEVGQGLELALAVLARFRTSVGAAATGFARRALCESVAHLKGRSQFGRPLGKFQGLRFDLAEMDARIRAAELLVEEAAGLVDLEKPSTAAVARAKLFATETAGWVCDRAVQLHGGLGVRRGTIVERLYREVRALRIYEGTSEIQRLILAKELLEGAGA